jgi:hypothetical protein
MDEILALCVYDIIYGWGSATSALFLCSCISRVLALLYPARMMDTLGYLILFVMSAPRGRFAMFLKDYY